MTLGRERATFAKERDAIRIIKALSTTAKSGNGLFTSGLPHTVYPRSAVARLLREWGVPIMATRRGNRSAWFILSLFGESTQKSLAEEWRRRIISDAYAEACRAHMGLMKQKFTKEDARVLVTVAVTLGDRLGYGVDEVIKDLTPTPMPYEVRDLLPKVSH
jgi:hypothetical protein